MIGIGNTRRGSIRLGIGFGLIAIMTAAAAAAAYSTDQKSKSQINAKTQHEVRAPSPTDLVEYRQLAIAKATEFGDASPAAIRLVATTRAAANSLDTGATVNTDQDVFMISQRGNFTWSVSDPDGVGRTLKGSVLTIVFDSETKAVTDVSLGDTEPNLAQLGPVIDLTK